MQSIFDWKPAERLRSSICVQIQPRFTGLRIVCEAVYRAPSCVRVSRNPFTSPVEAGSHRLLASALATMASPEGGPCYNCGSTVCRASSWYGQAGCPDYCHLRGCRRSGEEAGHIIKCAKRQRGGGGLEADGIEFGQGMELLKLKEFVASRVFGVGSLQGVVARRSQISEEQRALRFLVYGKFKLGEGDPGGYDYVWMTVLELLDCENVSEQEIDQVRLAWREALEEDWPTSLDG